MGLLLGQHSFYMGLLLGQHRSVGNLYIDKSNQDFIVNCRRNHWQLREKAFKLKHFGGYKAEQGCFCF
jgi:hypothetical protein